MIHPLEGPCARTPSGRSGSGVATLLLSIVSVLAVGACAGGGPGVEGARAVALYDTYSGTWVLDTVASDDTPELDELLPGPGRDGPFGGEGPGGGGFGPPGGGGPGGGGFPGGGARPGIGGGPGGGMRPPVGVGGGPDGAPVGMDRRNVEAARDMAVSARHRPERILLALGDSLLSVTLSGADRIVVPMDGEEVELPGARWPTSAKVEWDGLEPRLERTVEDAGRIVDRFQVFDRTRLVVTRTLETRQGTEIRLVFQYDRTEG